MSRTGDCPSTISTFVLCPKPPSLDGFRLCPGVRFPPPACLLRTLSRNSRLCLSPPAPTEFLTGCPRDPQGYPDNLPPIPRLSIPPMAMCDGPQAECMESVGVDATIVVRPRTHANAQRDVASTADRRLSCSKEPSWFRRGGSLRWPRGA